MAFPLQTLSVTVVLVSLLLGCTEKVSGMRYTFSDTTRIKHSDFPLNIAPQPSGKTPGLGRFLLPPRPPIAAAPVVAAPPIPSCEIPSPLSPKPSYEAPSPSSGEDQVPPVPQP